MSKSPIAPPESDLLPAEQVSGAAIGQEKNPIKRLFRILGPGLITGASDDDPSGIGTYAATGAALGLSSLWMALFSLPLMAASEFICAKIGLVSGLGLSGVLRKYYSRKLLYPIVAGVGVPHVNKSSVGICG